MNDKQYLRLCVLFSRCSDQLSGKEETAVFTDEDCKTILKLMERPFKKYHEKNNKGKPTIKFEDTESGCNWI